MASAQVGFRTGCQNISHYQQSFSGLQSPTWSFSIKVTFHLLYKVTTWYNLLYLEQIYGMSFWCDRSQWLLVLFVAWCCLIIISCLFSCLLNTYCLFFCWCLVVQIFVFFIISSCLPDCLVTQCSLLVCYLLICCLLDYTVSSPVCPSLQYQNFAITNSLSVLLHCRFVQTIAFWEF